MKSARDIWNGCVCVCSSNSVRCQNQAFWQDDISSGFQRRTNSLTVAGYVQQASAWQMTRPVRDVRGRRPSGFRGIQEPLRFKKGLRNGTAHNEGSNFAKEFTIPTWTFCKLFCTSWSDPDSKHLPAESAWSQQVCVLHIGLVTSAFHSPKLRPELAHHRCQSRFQGGGVLPARKALDVIGSS